jgi:isochorismate hydrolase
MTGAMKEIYFTSESIDAASRRMLAAVDSPRRSGTFGFAPGLAALLVLDMQRYFLDPASHAFVPSAPPIIDRIARIAGLFAGAGRPVIATRHGNTERDAGMLGRWWNDLVPVEGDAGVIVDGLAGAASTVLRKTQYDAFHETELEEVLRAGEASQVAVTGVMTHLCCETTARAAFVRGFEVFFVVDGTATYREEYHLASIRNLAHGFAVPVLSGELAMAFGGDGS